MDDASQENVAMVQGDPRRSEPDTDPGELGEAFYLSCGG